MCGFAGIEAPIFAKYYTLHTHCFILDGEEEEKTYSKTEIVEGASVIVIEGMGATDSVLMENCSYSEKASPLKS